MKIGQTVYYKGLICVVHGWHGSLVKIYDDFQMYTVKPEKVKQRKRRKL